MTVNAYSVAMAVMDRQLQGEVGLDRPQVNTMQLQKLVYYCQAYHLAWFGKPMFLEPVQAWTHGPVVRELWELHRRQISITKDDLKRSADLARVEEVDLDERQEMVVDAVCSALGGLTGWQLRNRTHDEDPWKNHFDHSDGWHEEVIPHDEMARYYSDS